MARTNIIYTVISLLIFCCGFSIASFAAVELEEGIGEIAPRDALVIVEDERANWTRMEAIEALASEGRVWDRPGFPSLGFSDSAYWASIDIENQFSRDQTWLVEMKFPDTDRLDFYYQDAEGNWIEKSAGDTLPFYDRDIKHHALIFRFPVIASQTQTLYFRIQTKGAIQLPIFLTSLVDFQLESQEEFFWIGLYYGLVGVIALYSLFIWFTSKDPSYLYFVLFLVSGGLYSFSFQGLSFQYLWPDSPYWANRSIFALTGLSCAAGLMFVRYFIELKTYQKKLDEVLRIVVYVALAYAAVSLIFPYGVLVLFTYAILLVIVVLVSVTSLLAARNGNRPAQFFLAAWSIFGLGILIEAAQRLGVNLPPLLSYHSIQYGTGLSAIILVFGLGDRFNSLNKEYSLLQRDMIENNQVRIAALQKADDAKDEFIANVSHELRTPLTGIIGLSEIILEKNASNLDDNALDNLRMIRISGQRLANLVNDVIDFSAIKTGELELNMKTVDLGKICRLVSKMCRALIGEKPIQLIEDFPSGPVFVTGDENRLQQILFNLISNAIKFTHNGWITVSIEIVDIDARVVVKDTGIGISKEQQRRIFNRFYQVDSGASRAEGGAGLGLAISQKLVELHGTEIILRSELGEGSTFYFDLPLLAEMERIDVSEGPAQNSLIKETSQNLVVETDALPTIVERRDDDAEDIQKGNDTAAFSSSGRQRSILVVDDEYLNVRIVKEHLSSFYNVESALSGHEALQMLGQNKPDLVILDLMMPIMTGFEVCQRIREQYSMDELPVVILTAKNRVEDLVKGLSVGANDYIKKPFSKEELKVRVAKQLKLLQLKEVRQENQLLSWQIQKYQETEKQLREREKRLVRMLDVTGDALVSIDESGYITNINKAAEDLLRLRADDFQGEPLSGLAERLETICEGIAETVSFPFDEAVISSGEEPNYHAFTIKQADDEPGMESRIRVCLLPLSLDQEFYLLMFQHEVSALEPGDEGFKDSLPRLIDQLNRNIERTQLLGKYLAEIKPEDLQKHKHLFADLESVDNIIQNLSGSIKPDEDDEQQYREALVKLMQDCQYHWQKVTGKSVIELAQMSRIWSVSSDNGRLRTRSMDRYLSIDKLPANPRWRQVARLAYFVLSKVSSDQEARLALEKSVARLQDIVESKALN